MNLTKKQTQALKEARVITQKGEYNVHVKAQIENFLKGELIRPFYYSRNNRKVYVQKSSGIDSLKAFISITCIKTDEGNDAPRGGLGGDYIKNITRVKKVVLFKGVI